MLLAGWPPRGDVDVAQLECCAGGVAMAVGATEWLVIAVVIVLLFGRGKVSELMGEIGRGISSFRRCLSEPDEKSISRQSGTTAGGC
jgi:sec-independent protein translocase protein TatA